MILDASALVCLLFAEAGHERVRKHVVGSTLSAVNLSEAVALFARRKQPVEELLDAVVTLRIEVVAFDAKLAVEAGMIWETTRLAGLSFGDPACLALARRRQQPVITADRAWASIAAEIGVEIVLIR